MNKEISEAVKARRLLSIAKYRLRNPDKIKASNAKYYRDHAEFKKSSSSSWRSVNPKNYKAAWRKANPGKANAGYAKRRATTLQATPIWADITAIKAIYIEASLVRMHVDHIIPLQGKTVCGLHVHYNLQLLTGSDNSRKGNRHWPGHDVATPVCWIEGS